MKKQTIITLVVSIIVALAVGFYGGTLYQKSKSYGQNQFEGGMMGYNNLRNNNSSTGTKMMGQNGTQRGGGYRPVIGEIIEVLPKSITVKLPDQSTRIVLLSDATQINKAEKGTQTDLKTGIQISAFGTTNTDGSVTAQNIQIGTGFGMMRGQIEGNNQTK